MSTLVSRASDSVPGLQTSDSGLFLMGLPLEEISSFTPLTSILRPSPLSAGCLLNISKYLLKYGPIDSRSSIKMKCPRCGSSMFCEKYYTHEGQLVFWRCVFCGDYIDPVVFQNRQYQKINREKRAKRKEE